MKYLIRSFLILWVLSPVGFTVKAQSSADQILGVWKSEDGVRTIKIYKDNGAYFGKILANSHAPKDKMPVGTVIMKNFVFEDGRWKGKLYIPSQDMSFKTVASLETPDKLKSALKIGFFTKSRMWNRVK